MRYLGNMIVLLASSAICIVLVVGLTWLLLRNSVSDRVEELAVRALGGDVQSQEELGDTYMYGSRFGIGPDRSPELAADWYLKAATGGSAGADVKLGMLYLGGRSVSQDYKRAMEHFQRAARREDPNGYYWIGRMYADGFGVLRNEVAALQQFQEAAEKGSAPAMWELSLAYKYGTLGLEPDIRRAAAWETKYRSARKRAVDLEIGRINKLLRNRSSEGLDTTLE